MWPEAELWPATTPDKPGYEAAARAMDCWRVADRQQRSRLARLAEEMTEALGITRLEKGLGMDNAQGTYAKPVVLSARDLSKSYGGIHALADVGLDLKAGEIHGLCGENGAGKSTFIKILGGFVRPNTGRDPGQQHAALRSGTRPIPN